MSASPPSTEALRDNNFDLLRLLAALQVVCMHSTAYLDPPSQPATEFLDALLRLFHGVPIFFVISGFLISRAYQRAPSFPGYARNRALRIYPGLWLVVACGLALIGWRGYLTAAPLSDPSFYAWIAGQVSFVQFYNPPFLRDFGVGALNGSLWTISVELQFYVAWPLLALARSRCGPRARSLVLPAVALVSLLIDLGVGPDTRASVFTKLLSVSLPKHLYLFVIGALVQEHFESLRRFFERRFLTWLGAYLLAALVLAAMAPAAPERLAWSLERVVGAFFLVGVTLSFAFSARGLSRRLLGRTDVSYGLYLYHMLAVNLLLEAGGAGKTAVLQVFLLTGSCAWISWRLVERPALRLKRTSARAAPPSEAQAPGAAPSPC